MHSFLMGRRSFSQPASWTEAARLLSFLGLILTMALCLVSSPRVALAQGDERSVVVLDIEGSKAKDDKFRALVVTSIHDHLDRAVSYPWPPARARTRPQICLTRPIVLVQGFLRSR